MHPSDFPALRRLASFTSPWVANWVLSVFGIEGIYGRDDLREIILCLGFLRLVLHAAKSGKQQVPSRLR